MPLFEMNGDKSPKKLKKSVFKTEKELQELVESHLEVFFKIKFIGSEVSTGEKHGGRIDTLGIDENGSPVIIEYKKEKSRDIMNQGLFYLDWLLDHQGDFQVMLQDNVAKYPEIQWDRPRVILIANNFTKYDRHAVQRIGENIELKEYTLYKNNLIEFDDVYVPASLSQTRAESETQESYTVEYHLSGGSQSSSEVPKEVKNIFQELREFMLDLDEVTEVPLKQYIAYKSATNFCGVVLQKSQLKLFLDLTPKTFDDPYEITRDVSEVGHWATGEIEIKVKTGDNLEPVKELLETSYRENS